MFDWRLPQLRGAPFAALIGLCGLLSTAPVAATDAVQDNLYGVSFVTSDLGWVSGAFGTIARTVDGGKTWERQASNATESLYSVDFVDERLGWVVGRTGTIVHTENGGADWKPQKSPSDKHLFSVDFVDGTFGIAVGDWGVILVTEDGGRTWNDRSLTEDLILNSISVVDRKTALIAGEIGSLFRTDDGGRTWTRLDGGLDKTLFGIRCVDAQRCWAVGIDAIVLRTTDGGATWAVRNGSTQMRALEQVGFGQAFENPSLYSVAFAGDFGVAAGELGSVFVSRDAGATWKRLEASKNWALPWFGDLILVAGDDGAIVGARGSRVMIRNGEIELDPEGD